MLQSYPSMTTNPRDSTPSAIPKLDNLNANNSADTAEDQMRQTHDKRSTYADKNRSDDAESSIIHAPRPVQAGIQTSTNVRRVLHDTDSIATEQVYAVDSGDGESRTVIVSQTLEISPRDDENLSPRGPPSVTAAGQQVLVKTKPKPKPNAVNAPSSSNPKSKPGTKQ